MFCILTGVDDAQKNVFSYRRTVVSVVASINVAARLFQARGTTIGNARSPRVDRRVSFKIPVAETTSGRLENVGL
jgi:hypothetical protein